MDEQLKGWTIVSLILGSIKISIEIYKLLKPAKKKRRNRRGRR